MNEKPSITVRMGIEERLQRFNEALLGEDELGAVIRGHIYVENELIDFIGARLPYPQGMKGLRLGYHGRIQLATSLGLSESFGPGLKFVGKLRNRFAHQLDAVIGEQDATEFEDALGQHKAVTHEAHRTAHINLGTHETAVPIRKLEPRDRITLGFVTLWAAMAVAAYRASHPEDRE